MAPSRSSPGPSAVIFDMDGLMLDTERISLRVWQQAAGELGYVLDARVAEAMIGRSAPANRVLLEAHFGPSFSYDALADLARARYLSVLAAEGVPRKPGLVELLEFLEARGVPRAVATSTARDLARHKLDRAGVGRYFDVVVGGDEVVDGKPAPDIFLLAADRLGQEPARCVVLEDSGPGIRAARSAGMVPILIPDGREPAADTRALSAFVVDSLRTAQPLLERLLDVAQPSQR
jgi:HAD superfamily hydrolase (TIGR01509 family)